MDGLKIGRIVLFRTVSGELGKHRLEVDRAAIVVATADTEDRDLAGNEVDLHVFETTESLSATHQGVSYSEFPEPGTWRWPER